jgi:hypothetical protein
VLEYLDAWAGRIKVNDGLCPDNVGPSGVIGELMNGKWWGGYYGWCWPHGVMSILQPLMIAAMNAVLLTGDMGYLDIPRGQLDRMIDLGRTENGQLLVPHRHTTTVGLLIAHYHPSIRCSSGLCHRISAMRRD